MADKENQFQQIQDLGFAGLINRFRERTGKKNDNVLHGIGEDCSVFECGDGMVQCTTTEIFQEGVHFDLTYTPFHHLGYKVVTAAVSDLYAMNAKPEQLLVAIAIPNRYSVQMMETFYEGVDAASNDYGIEVSGGDTTASHQIFSVSVTATGTTKKDDLILRSGSEEGDVVCVTGDLGSALAGLRVLLREKKSWQDSGEQHFQPDLSAYQSVVQRQLLPKARLDFTKALQTMEIRPTSLIDVSQGLMNEIRALAASSGNGFEIYSPAIPISMDTRKVADEMNEDVDKYAFYGGEDFELLFTLPESQVEAFRADFDDFVVIGKVTDNPNTLRINTGEENSYEVDLS